MSAELLRQAATILRERAEVATPGPWTLAEDWAYVASGADSVIHGYYEGDCPSCGDDIEDDASVALSGEDATLIATMHPGVALALADVLDEAAAQREGQRRHLVVAFGDDKADDFMPDLPAKTEHLARLIVGESND